MRFLDLTGLARLLERLRETFAPLSHTHAASQVTSGTLSADRLPTVPVSKGGTGSASASAARSALGITPANIGAATSGHTHGAATTSAAGFLSASDKAKLDGVATGANRYVHPSSAAGAITAGLWKIATDAQGHVTGATAVTKADITALGIPGADTNTTYGLASTSANGLLRQLSGSTSQYMRGDGTWATPPNTTYGVATSSANGLMSAADKTKLDGVASGANRTTVDSALSSTSTNPVQNKVVNSALAGKAAASHTHTIAQVSNLQSALDGKAASSHTHNYAGSSSAGGAATSAAKVNVTTLTSQNLNDYRTPGTFFAAGGGNTCTNKPSGIDNFGMFVIQSAGGWQTQFLYGSNDVTYTRAYHGGTWTSWVEMYTSANKPTASEIGAAAASHSHAASAITSGTLSSDRLPTVPIAKGGTGATSASAARTALGAAASSHSHSASNITSGTLPVARGGTGVTSDDALRQKVLNYLSNDELLAYLGLS